MKKVIFTAILFCFTLTAFAQDEIVFTAPESGVPRGMNTLVLGLAQQYIDLEIETEEDFLNAFYALEKNAEGFYLALNKREKTLRAAFYTIDVRRAEKDLLEAEAKYLCYRDALLNGESEEYLQQADILLFSAELGEDGVTTERKEFLRSFFSKDANAVSAGYIGYYINAAEDILAKEYISESDLLKKKEKIAPAGGCITDIVYATRQDSDAARMRPVSASSHVPALDKDPRIGKKYTQQPDWQSYHQISEKLVKKGFLK